MVFILEMGINIGVEVHLEKLQGVDMIHVKVKSGQTSLILEIILEITLFFTLFFIAILVKS